MPYRGSAPSPGPHEVAASGPSHSHSQRCAVASVAVVVAFVAGAELIVDRLPRSHVPRVAPTHVEPPREERRLMASSSDDLGYADEYDPFAGLNAIRPNSYETETGEWRFVVPINGLRIVDAAPRDVPIPRRIVRQGAAVHAGRLFDCYRAALAGAPGLSGVVHVAYRIQPNGTTSPPEVQSRELSEPRLLRCVQRSFSGLLYRPPGASQEVRFALHLER